MSCALHTGVHPKVHEIMKLPPYFCGYLGRHGVKGMCKYCGGVLGGVSNPHYQYLSSCKQFFSFLQVLAAIKSKRLAHFFYVLWLHLRLVRKIAKSYCYVCLTVCLPVPSVRTSARPNETTQLQLDGFALNLTFEYFLLYMYFINVSLKPDKNNGYFT
jgi:hypothetical protein